MSYNYSEARPAVYVGTYGKYNEGSIYGAWLNPGDYDTIDDFFSACSELHKDEPEGAREFMFQDKEYIPGSLYSECSFTDAEFAFCKAWDEISDGYALESFIDAFGINDITDEQELLEKFNEAFYGEFDSDEDLAYSIVDDSCMLQGVPENVAMYFDYSAYARDLMITDFTEYNGYYFWTNF